MKKELKLDKRSNYSLCVDQTGIITKASSAFANLLGYSTEELMNKQHNIVWRLDMPKIIFKIMWDKLNNGETFIGFIKHQSKSGDYCWLSNKAYLHSNEPNGTCKYFSYQGFSINESQISY
ncbi:PAS domain-containing protein [Sulfurovum mangrovi]|uniref:PAS domain-containing protein n=1 Tax=Sulfurovum mangrovi TaxID=2893889 RepID=UPI001E361327|nr:PAS domain-containing protein [Sulfurovum mangrovi]UFH59623.1 PAS domain-containing protein [Sulfurovum mangrovi]UFH60763.1 PAS domain-containing protein [Sulfurovum mangrovi]